MASAGVLLLQDIKSMFESSTLDYLTSKTIIERLTADPEKPWAEWSRGRPITEKGLAGLLHEYRIASRTVGPRGAEAKGYRRADLEDAWERHLTAESGDAADDPSEPDNLPSKRRSPSGDYIFAENSAVEAGDVRREKNGRDSNEINAFDVSTGAQAPWGPFSRFPRCDDDLDIPECLLVANRKVPLDRRPALGPEGDSLDDLK